MLFAPENTRYLYGRSPLLEVICQLRFPTILSIGAKDPVDFQEKVRGEYPRYLTKQDYPAPKVAGVGGPNAALQQQPPITNYHFISQDNRWKINLTQNFISLSTVGYTRWEDFAQRLDKVLATFIPIYSPAYFERIGLRYVNAISRKAYGLDGFLWDDLIQSHLLGILGEPDVMEGATTKCALDVEMKLEGDLRMKLHSGPGLLGHGQQKPQGEPRFILDGDFSATGNLSLEQIPGKLDAMHTWAGRLFRGAITQQLHEAMDPTPL